MTPTLLALALTASAPQLKEPPKKDPPVIGRWAAQSIVINGMEQKGNGMDYEFTKDGRWLIFHQGKEAIGTNRTYALEKATPGAIDLNERGDGQAYPGVFKVERDTLTVTFRIDGTKERPANVGARGAGYMSLVMTRVKSD